MRAGLKAEGPLDAVAIASGRVPAPIFEAYFAVGLARAIMAGTSLGVFAALAERADDADGLARRLGLDRDGVDVLVCALHDAGYLDAVGASFRPARVAQRYLLPGARSVERWTGDFGYDMWDAFADLEHTLRTGEHQGLHDKDPGDPYWRRYMRGLFQVSRLSAPTVARLVPAEHPRSLLDLAGGHGAFAMAMCARHAGLRATIVELAGAAPHAREIVAEEGMADRVAVQEGDLFEADLGTGHDVAMANNLVHHLDADTNVRLLERARGALRPGGTVAVFDLERGRDQLGAIAGLLFYVTSGARTYTGAEIAELFARAGLREIRAHRHVELPGSVLVTGRVA